MAGTEIPSTPADGNMLVLDVPAIADVDKPTIAELTAFAKTFFAKHSLLSILTKYCVLTADRMLLVMRPYQIVATERILQRIDIATNAKTLGSVAAGGYVWRGIVPAFPARAGMNRES